MSSTSSGATGSTGGPPADVPAPPMMLLFGLGASGLVARKRLAKKAAAAV
ncbi:PEP-CTERM sorting domain-containing protein [Sphingomonas sp. GlSt437]